jgi:D-amino-acid dehydrogenase
MDRRAGKPSATVIGAGIVGICCAAYLQREGYVVEVIDPEPSGTHCSHGNAGGIDCHAGDDQQDPRLAA